MGTAPGQRENMKLLFVGDIVGSPGRQIVANTLDITIDVPEEGDFGAGLGAARLALTAATGADPFEVCAPPKIRETIEPDRNLVPAYAEAYATYRDLYPALKEATSQ